MNKVFKGDRGIYAILIMLALVSFVAVASTSGSVNGPWNALLGQVFTVIIGFVILVLFENLSYNKKLFKWFSFAGVAISIVSLIVLPFVGIEGGEAHRTIDMKFFSFQPIEVAKMFTMIMVSYLCANKISDINSSWKDCIIYLMLPLVVMMGLILPQNLSSVIIIAVPTFFILLMANVKGKYLLTVCGVAVVALAIYVLVGGQRMDTWKSRFNTYSKGQETVIVTDPVSGEETIIVDDPRTAVGNGGLFGTFPGNGKVKWLLDNRDKDYVYSCLVEEGGMILGVFVLIIYVAFMFRVVKISINTRDLFGKYLAFSLGFLIVFQAFVHMMVCVGLIPVTGQQLPFISRGRSSFLMLCMAVGIIQNVAANNNIETKTTTTL